MNRRSLALKRDFTAITYTSCSGCEVGDKHAAQLLETPQPRSEPMEEQKQYAERVCARDKKTKFVPKTGVQKACLVCDPCMAAVAKLIKGKPARSKQKPRIRPSGAPKAVPMLPKSNGLDAAAWLKLGGFQVEVVNAPSGAWFRMVS